VASDAGTVQGAPLAGFLACFSLLACTRAAKASLRTSVAALPADDVQGRRAMASGMADDTTLVARPQHLVTVCDGLRRLNRRTRGGGRRRSIVRLHSCRTVAVHRGAAYAL
jgi:hypothetical protein